jgi:Peptidase_C39 like family
MPATKILDVPYYLQPTSITCQSTVLKMFASYLEQSVVMASTGAANCEITDIWKDINQSPVRPSKLRNAHANMKWWLEKHFPMLRFQYIQTTDEAKAVETIVRSIDGGFPVLVAVSHVNVEGHIVLVTGYENYVPQMSSLDFKLLVHDPYGKFDPSLKSKLFGGRRFDFGACLQSGGEVGAGRFVRVPITAASRQRPGDRNWGTYYLLSATR